MRVMDSKRLANSHLALERQASIQASDPGRSPS